MVKGYSTFDLNNPFGRFWRGRFPSFLTIRGKTRGRRNTDLKSSTSTFTSSGLLNTRRVFDRPVSTFVGNGWCLEGGGGW